MYVPAHAALHDHAPHNYKTSHTQKEDLLQFIGFIDLGSHYFVPRCVHPLIRSHNV